VQVALNGASQSASAPLQAGEDRELDVTLDTQLH
jgi:hypothetical protein